MPIQTTRNTGDYKGADIGLDRAAHPNVPINGSPFGKGVQQAYGPDTLHKRARSPQHNKILPRSTEK